MGWYTEYSYNYCEFMKNNIKKNYKGKKKSNLVQMPNMQPHIVSNHSREKKTLNVIALYNRHSCVPQKEKIKKNKNTQHIHHQSIQSEPCLRAEAKSTQTIGIITSLLGTDKQIRSNHGCNLAWHNTWHKNHQPKHK